jgi:hypothetical protein
VTTPGFFELYASARPALPAGSYTAGSSQKLVAQTPHDGPATVPVDDTQFHFDIVAPRYVMPPDQILSTFPPATSQGDWRERLPQIVLKRRTLPWERNPDPAVLPENAPPWLALVVLADGEGRLSTDIDVAQCVTPGITLDDEADVPRGKYLEVTKDIVEKVFPCRDELDLLCHVRRVDLSDTELALGDDDGYLAVILSNRLPQPAAPKTKDADATPLKYTAYLINLEKQLDKLLPTEPNPMFSFNALETTAYINPDFLAPAPNATLDQIAIGLGPGVQQFAKGKVAGKTKKVAQGPVQQSSDLISYGTGKGIETAAGSWAMGPAKSGSVISQDLTVASGYKAGINEGILVTLMPVYRFPVLVSWEFTCTGEGGFERLMNALDVGLLGTVDEPTTDTANPARPEVASTGHIALSHLTRRGESNTIWYRGPLSPQPTVRTVASGGALPLAHTAEQLRKLVPDGREDISLAALFEIGRLLTLNKPMLVASLMSWRADLFGAARARELADALAASIAASIGVSAAGGRNSLEDLLRQHVVQPLAGLPPDKLGPVAGSATSARVPAELAGLAASAVLNGLGAGPKVVSASGKAYGVDGLTAVPVTVGQAPTIAASQDKLALADLQRNLNARLDQLMTSTLKASVIATRAADQKRRRGEDALDQLIAEAEACAADADESED